MGCLESVIVWLAGGKLQSFIASWIIYSFLSIRHANRVQIACEEYQKTLKGDEADSGIKGDSACDALIFGFFFPVVMGASSFLSSGILDLLGPSLTHLWRL